MIYLPAAFDHIHRDWLFSSVRVTLGESKLINLLENMYKKTECYMTTTPKARFQTSAGVRQGGNESIYLYNLSANHCIKLLFRDRCVEKNLQTFQLQYKIPKECSKSGQKPTNSTTEIHSIGYADDLVVDANNIEDLQSMLNIKRHLSRTRPNHKRAKNGNVDPQLEVR